MKYPELPYGYPAQSDSDRSNTQGPNGEASANNSGGSTNHNDSAPLSSSESNLAKDTKSPVIRQSKNSTGIGGGKTLIYLPMAGIYVRPGKR